MANTFGIGGKDDDVSRLLTSLLSDSVSENIDKIVSTLGKSLDKDMEKRLKGYASGFADVQKKRFKVEEDEAIKAEKRAAARAEETGKKLAAGIVGQISSGITTAVSSIMGTMGRMDLKGSFSSGTSMAADLRRSMGQLTFGKNSLKDLGSVMTNSYRDLKNQGLIVDPKVVYEIYSKMGQMVSIAGMSAAKQQELVVTMTKIAQSGLRVDLTSLGSQNIRNVFGTEGLEKTVSSIGVFTGKFENYTETLAAALYSNNDLINSYMIRAEGKDKEFQRYIQAQAKVTGALSDSFGGGNAGNIMDVYNKLVTGKFNIGEFSSSVVGQQVTQAIRSRYGANTEIDKEWLAQNPDKFAEAIVNSVTRMGSMFGGDYNKLQLAMQASPGSFAGVMGVDNLNALLTQLKSGKGTGDLIAELSSTMSPTAAEQNNFYASASNRYTAVEAINFQTTMAGYLAGTKTYESASLETLGVIAGAVEEIAGGAVWKTLGEGAAQGIFSSAMMKGLTSTAGGASAPAGSLLGSLGSAGAIVGVVGAGLAAIAIGIKTAQQINKEAGNRGSASVADTMGAINTSNPWTGVSAVQSRNASGALTVDWVSSSATDYDSAINSIDSAIKDIRYRAQYDRASVGGREGASSKIYALEERKRILASINKLGADKRPLAAEMYNAYVTEGIIPGPAGSDNERMLKNLHAFSDNFDSLFYIYSSDRFGPGGSVGQNGIPDKLLSELSWVNGFLGQPGTFKKGFKQFDSKLNTSNALATGFDNIPHDGFPALLHEGEMVIPAKQANYIRAMMGQQLRNTSNVPSKKQTGNNSLVQSIPEYASGIDMVKFAQAQLGEPYVWGAKGPDSWDCSGLVDGAYESTFGKRLGKNANGWGKYMVPVNKADSRPGDLVVSNWGPHATSGVVGWRHVGIVAGNGGTSYLQAKSGKGVIFERDGGTPWSKWGRLPGLLNAPADYFNDSTAVTGLIGNGLTTRPTRLYGSSGYDTLEKYNLNVVRNLQKEGLLMGTATGGVGTSLGTMDTGTSAVPDNAAFNSNRYKGLLTKYANKYGIPPLLLYGIMMAESSGNPNSNLGKASSYKGLMQVNQGKVDKLFGPGKNIYDPEINIATGANYLKKYNYDKFKHWTLATGGYNHGPGYAAWMNAKNILDAGYSWDTLISRVGTTSHMSSGSNSIKDSYINSVYKRAGLPKSGVFLEKGGIIQDPVMAVMGEGKHDEAVIPLDDKDHFGIENLRVDVLDAMNVLGTAVCNRLDTIIKNQVTALMGTGSRQRTTQADRRIESLRGFDYNM